MTQNYYTPIVNGDSRKNDAAIWNDPLGGLDSQISNHNTEITNARGAYTNLAARFNSLILAGSNVATLTNGAASAGQKVVTVDSSVGFIAGGRVAYTLVGGTIEYNTINTVDSGLQLTMTTNLGTGGIANNTYISMLTESEYQAALAVNAASSGVSRTLPNAMQWAAQQIYNVLAYGAAGNGSTDDTAAIAAALTAASSTGGVVLLPVGHYQISAIEVPANVTLTGQGSGTTLEVTSTTGDAITLNNDTCLTNLTLLYEGQSASARQLIFNESDNVIITGLIVNCTDVASAIHNNKVTAIHIENSAQNVIISNCILLGPNQGAPFYDSVGVVGWGIHLQNNATDGISAHIGGVICDGWNDGIKISCPNANLTITGCILRNNNRDGMDCYYSESAHITVGTCIFANNQDLIADFKSEGSKLDDGEPYAVIFANNICHDHTNASGTGVLSFFGNSGVSVCNNQFYNQLRGVSLDGGAGGQIIGNRFQLIQHYGISVDSVDDGDVALIVSGNLIIDSGVAEGNASTDGGIFLADTTNAIVTNNAIYWTAGQITTWNNVSGIRISAGTVLKCLITGNYTNRTGTMIGGGSTWTDNYIFGNVNITTELEGTLRWDSVNDKLQAYTGSVWGSLAYVDVAQSWSAAQLFVNGVRSGNVSISDDNVATLTGIPTRGILCISTGAAADEAAIIAYRAESTPFCTVLVGTNTAGVTTDVTGTTGTDGWTTVSMQSTGVIKIENRQGGGRTVVYTVLG